MTLEQRAWHHDEDRIGRYVADRMSPDERDAFEGHLLECDTCQELVRLGLAVRAGARGRRLGLPAVGVAAAAAAAIAVVLLTLPSHPWDDLARLDVAPAFVPATVRSATDSTARLAENGMDAYRRGDFHEAAEHLSRAHTLAPADEGIAFFAGASELLRDRPRAALGPLRVAAGGSSPYAHEAGILLAKAWLRIRQPDSALAALDAVRADPRVPVGAWARALADSIRGRDP